LDDYGKWRTGVCRRMMKQFLNIQADMKNRLSLYFMVRPFIDASNALKAENSRQTAGNHDQKFEHLVFMHRQFMSKSDG
jgi:hypothetical protein